MIPNYTSLENLCKWPNKNSKNKKKKGVPARIIFFFFWVKQKCELIGTKAVDICRVMRTKS
jgi:hypothetical protein